MASWKPGKVREYWDSVGSRYQELFQDELQDKPFNQAILADFAARLGTGARVCDMGCGPAAHVTRHLADLGMSVVGIDSSKRCIELARTAQPTLELREMDVLNPTFADSSLDGIVAAYLFHYLPRDAWRGVLAAFRRIIRPGGLILVIQKQGDGEGYIADPLGGPLETFWSAASASALKAIVSASGFDDIESATRKASDREIPVDRIYLLARRPT